MNREFSAESRELLLGLEAGETIFREGDPGAEMFIIASGEVGIFAGDEPGRAPLAVLRAGDFFGELALLEGEARTASARALSACRLLVIDASTFDQMIHRDPEIAIRMLRKLAGRLRRVPREQRGPEVPALAPPPAVAAAGAEPPPALAKEAGGPRLVHLADGAVFPVKSDGETVVGRLDSAAGLRPDVDLDDIDVGRTVSRRHAKIQPRGDGFVVVEDVGAANPTFLNGERLGKGVPAPLAGGDRLCFGSLELIFLSG